MNFTSDSFFLSTNTSQNLSLTYLQPRTKTFLELLFITIILHSQKQASTKRDEKALKDIFIRIEGMPQRARAIQYFLKKVVSKTDVAGGKSETETVKWGCKVAKKTLI